MKALQITSFGGRPALCDIPRPTPAKGEILIEIKACGLNFADLLMIDGKYQERPSLPLTLGMEPAGIVRSLGPDTEGPAPGTRVAVYTNGGGLAEFGCFAVDRCLPLPPDMPFDHAAALQIAYGTSHVALDHRAQLKQGETLLVLGAAGGVGLTAVEIGKRMGARVIACARGAEKLGVAEAAGADHLIDSDAGDLRAAVKALGGADVVYDPVGGDQFDAAFRATRPGGRIIVIGFASGRVPQIAANHLLVKNITVIGHYWGGFLRFRPDLLRQSLHTLLAWYGEGKLHPHIGHTLQLPCADAALDLLRTRKSVGKVVVTM
ncbi:MAG: NADPH:quinone oxidoreductase family protein [Rhodobacteraceae bacterium]|nr:NADPH:quinone oxidoreductase family protein [Paracoccaceae bacterium]MCP5342077.1 NADPH:quinone oxidoreductase family protein [Paracoccaceae bacterium]